MKKLTAILKESGLKEELVPLREKEISRLFEEIKDASKTSEIRKQAAFQKGMNLLGDEHADVRKVFKNLMGLRISIKEEDIFRKEVSDFEKELNSEVEDPKEKADNE